MSGICGIVNFDGAPVDPEILRKMAGAAAYRGPDGIHYWIDGHVGLAHLALHTTPEAARERQPLVNRRGDLVLAADARVDNRDDLIRTLTSKGCLQDKDPTDADLILAAYECWGADCPKQIIGDFAFAIWDRREQKLFCARDVIGVRSFFYCRQGQSFFFGSAITNIMAGLEERPPLNELFIVDFLCWWHERMAFETIYQGVYRFPAAYTFTVDCDGDCPNHYWPLGAQAAPRYKADQEYVEHFRDLFKQAVLARLRSNTDVGIAVSGGLDSSSITCLAHRMFYSEGLANQYRKVRLYSIVFNQFRHADEREYLDAVAVQCENFPIIRLEGEIFWGFKEFSNENGFPLDQPEISPLRAMLTGMLQAAQQDGCRVMLTGEGGDQVFNTSAYLHPELLFDVNLTRIFAEFAFFWKKNGARTFQTLLWKLLVPSIKRIIPESLIQQHRLASRLSLTPIWVKQDWVKQSHTMSSHLFLRLPALSLNYSSTAIHRQITGGWYASLLDNLGVVYSFCNAEYRLPYLDRRIVDFVLLIPTRLRFSKGITKCLLREAMRGILPDLIRQRNWGAHVNELVIQGLYQKEQNRIKALLRDIEGCQTKFIEVSLLIQVLTNTNQARNWFGRTVLAPLLFQTWYNCTFLNDI
jgi:asparagine synthase (glutamine-hydrolysing)